MNITCGWKRVESRSFLVRLDQAAKPIILIHRLFNILFAHEHADLRRTTPLQDIALLTSIQQFPSKQSAGASTMAVSDAVTGHIRPDVEEEAPCFFWKLPLEVRDMIYELLYGHGRPLKVVTRVGWKDREKVRQRLSKKVTAVSQ